LRVVADLPDEDSEDPAWVVFVDDQEPVEQFPA
jgi:hypothetical protein